MLETASDVGTIGGFLKLLFCRESGGSERTRGWTVVFAFGGGGA